MTWSVVGANFDQMHVNDNLEWFAEHPDTEVVGVCDEEPSTSTGSVDDAVAACDLSADAVFDDLDECLETLDPDVLVGCPRNAEHAPFVERVVPYDVHLVVEKPMAATLAGADRILEATADSDRLFVVSWPVMWDPVLHTVRDLVATGTIGDVHEVQYYGGNAGAPPTDSWFYDDEAGGGSMLDYLGYGATFSTWFRDGELPTEVTAERYVPEDLEVDVQSVTVCRYEDGLSTLQTTWRMLTNPWEIQPTPSKGYEVIGSEGSISTRDPDAPILVTTKDRPEGYEVEADDLPERYRNLAYYVVDRLERNELPEGPANPEFCRAAQRIVETARRSSEEGTSLDLVD